MQNKQDHAVAIPSVNVTMEDTGLTTDRVMATPPWIHSLADTRMRLTNHERREARGGTSFTLAPPT